MYKVEKHKISKNDIYFKRGKAMIEIATNFYNFANFIVRKNWEFNKTDDGKRKYINFYSMRKLIMKIKEQRKDLNLHILPSSSWQEVLRTLDQNWQSYFGMLKNGKFEIAKMPRIYKNNEFVNLIATNLQTRFKKDESTIYFSKHFDGFKLKPYKANKENIKQVRFVYNKNNIRINVIYDDFKESPLKIKEKPTYSIEIENKEIKMYKKEKLFAVEELQDVFSLNAYWNRKLEKYLSFRMKDNTPSKTNKARALYDKRYNSLDTSFHRISKKIVDLISGDIGENRTKHLIKIKMRERCDENEFIKIPFYALIGKLEYKFINEGINVEI